MKKPLAGPAVWAYGHPVVVLLLAVLIVFSGLLAVGRLPIDLSVFNGYPQIRVRILDPGVPAALMEDRVTQPLEQALADITGSVDMVSASSEGLSEIAIFVDGARNLSRVRRQVGAHLEALRSVLPAGVAAPQVEIRDSDHIPVAELVVRSATRTRPQLQAWVEQSLIPQFVDIAGFDRIEVVGGQVREIYIVPDQRQLAALGLALADVIDSVRAYELHADSSHRSSFAQDAIQTLGALPLRLANGDTVAMSEVTNIQEVEADTGERVYRDAIPSLRLLLFKRPRASTLGMLEMFKSRLAWLRTNKLIPPPIEVEWWANSLLELKRMGRSFLTLSAGALVLALLITGIFRRNVRGLLAISAAALVSLMLVFTFYRLAGLGINAHALSGMMLGYGFIFGLPWLVLEILGACSRQRSTSSIHGLVGACSRQRSTSPIPGLVSLPPVALDQDLRRRAAQRLVFTVLLLAAAVLVPVLVYGGLPGLIFRDLIIALTTTIVAASIVSITLVPALTRATPRADPSPRRSVYRSWLQHLYAMPRRIALAALAILISIPIGLYYSHDNQRFLTYPDSAEVLLYVDMQPEISQEQVMATLSTIELLARDTGDVASVLTHLAAADAHVPAYSEHKAQLLRIRLSPEMQRKGGASAWMRNFERTLAASSLKGIALRSVASSYLALERFEDPIMRAASGEVYGRIYGLDRAVLMQLGAGMVQRLQALPGLRHVRLTAGAERLQTVVRLAPAHATEPGLDEIAVARALRVARGGLVIGDIPSAGRHMRLRVILPELAPRPGRSLPPLLLRGEIDTHAAVYLDNIADSEELPMPAVRWRDRQRPMVEVRGALATPVSSRDVLHAVRDSLEQYSLPPGYHAEFAGFIDSMARATQHSLVLVILVSALIFGILLLVLRAARAALLIGFNVMLAWAGGIGGMVATGLPWSLPVWLGGILLIAFAMVLTWVTLDGIHMMRTHPTRAATLNAAAYDSNRMVLGFGACGLICLVPLATGLVPGFEWLQPLAVLMGLGMVFSLVGNLLLTPILFCRLEK